MIGKLQKHCEDLEVLWAKFQAKENKVLNEQDHEDVKTLVLEGKPAVAAPKHILNTEKPAASWPRETCQNTA